MLEKIKDEIDIDHLGNRRIRSVGELVENQREWVFTEWREQ